MRAAKRRALRPDEEPNLYDQEDAEAEENEEVDASNEEEAHTNGAKPEEVAYLETEDEEELRAIISNIDDVVEEMLAVPEWQVKGKDGKPRVVTILLRSLTTFERTNYIKAIQKSNNDMTKVYADLVILSARHPKTKKLLFKSADRGMLQNKMGKATERIAARASELNGLTAESFEEMRKNSGHLKHTANSN